MRSTLAASHFDPRNLPPASSREPPAVYSNATRVHVLRHFEVLRRSVSLPPPVLEGVMQLLLCGLIEVLADDRSYLMVR